MRVNSKLTLDLSTSLSTSVALTGSKENNLVITENTTITIPLGVTKTYDNVTSSGGQFDLTFDGTGSLVILDSTGLGTLTLSCTSQVNVTDVNALVVDALSKTAKFSGEVDTTTTITNGAFETQGTCTFNGNFVLDNATSAKFSHSTTLVSTITANDTSVIDVVNSITVQGSDVTLNDNSTLLLRASISGAGLVTGASTTFVPKAGAVIESGILNGIVDLTEGTGALNYLTVNGTLDLGATSSTYTYARETISTGGDITLVAGCSYTCESSSADLGTYLIIDAGTNSLTGTFTNFSFPHEGYTTSASYGASKFSVVVSE